MSLFGSALIHLLVILGIGFTLPRAAQPRGPADARDHAGADAHHQGAARSRFSGAGAPGRRRRQSQTRHRAQPAAGARTRRTAPAPADAGAGAATGGDRAARHARSVQPGRQNQNRAARAAAAAQSLATDPTQPRPGRARAARRRTRAAERRNQPRVADVPGPPAPQIRQRPHPGIPLRALHGRLARQGRAHRQSQLSRGGEAPPPDGQPGTRCRAQGRRHGGVHLGAAFLRPEAARRRRHAHHRTRQSVRAVHARDARRNRTDILHITRTWKFNETVVSACDRERRRRAGYTWGP